MTLMNQLMSFYTPFHLITFFSICYSPQVKSNSTTLIDSILSNMAALNINSGNLTALVSDHLSQFLVAANIYFNSSYPKFNKYASDWSKFDQENSLLDYFSVDWHNILQSNMSTDIFCKNFHEKYESLDTYAPLKKSLKTN